MQVKHTNSALEAMQLWEASNRVGRSLAMEGFPSKQTLLATRKEDILSSPLQYRRDKIHCTASKALQSEDISHLRQRTQHKPRALRHQESTT